MTPNNRILKRILFIKKHRRLCTRAFKPEVSHPKWKYPAGRQLVTLARKELKYSNTTASCDIFWTTYMLYKWLREK